MMYDNTKVSLELREIVESGVNIFDFDYEYKGLDKEAFEQKVIDHYYFRQIGQETVGRFKHCFKTKIIEIMPYYNQLFDSERLMQNVGDPFESYNLTETFTRDVSENGTVETETTGTNTTTDQTTTTHNESATTTETTENMKKFSNTPQGDVANLDNYLTEATHDEGENTTTGTGESTNTTDGTQETESTTSGSQTTEGSTKETYTMTRKGNIGVQPYGQEIKYYRDSFLNIDLMIIKELNNLFLMVY